MREEYVSHQVQPPEPRNYPICKASVYLPTMALSHRVAFILFVTQKKVLVLSIKILVFTEIIFFPGSHFILKIIFLMVADNTSSGDLSDYFILN